MLRPRLLLLALLVLAANRPDLVGQECLLRPRTPPAIGSTIEFVLAAPRAAAKPYMVGCSLARAAGIPLSDGRVVSLSVDDLLLLSLTPSLPEFAGFQGALDARGEAVFSLAIPADPALDGLEFALAGVVIDPAASAGIAAVTQPLSLRLRTASNAPDFSAVTSRLQTAIGSGALAGAGLLVVDDWGPRYTNFFGTFSANTVVPIASATKWISALLLMTLVDDGLLTLDTPLGTHYPFLPIIRRNITLRQLFSHTSGLPSNAPCLGSDTITLQACADQILGLPLSYLPGTAFLYGGPSMHVAGAVAELAVAAAGAPSNWNQLFQSRFLQPLGITNMTFGPGPNPRIAGGLQSNLADLAPILRMLLAGGRLGSTEVVSAPALALMLGETGEGLPVLSSPGAALSASGYGFGVWRLSEDQNLTTFEAGSMGAFGSAFWVDLSHGYGAWLLTLDNGTADAAAVIADLRPLLRAALN